MTNSIQEIEQAKVLLVIGSNTTEAHPVISYYMKRARKNGATLIVCDPRVIDLCRWHHGVVLDLLHRSNDSPVEE